MRKSAHVALAAALVRWTAVAAAAAAATATAVGAVAVVAYYVVSVIYINKTSIPPSTGELFIDSFLRGSGYMTIQTPVD